jgi:glycosyltransferase involved in cell wall biosynthesis
MPDGSAYSGLLLADGLSEDGWEVHVAFGSEGPMVDEYGAAGHQTHVVPHDNWLRRDRTHQFVKDIWLEWRKASAFKAIVNALSLDLVYLNTVVSLAGAVAAHRMSVPCVWHLREMFADIGGEMRAPNWAIPLVRWVIHTHADQILANSTATASNLLGERVEGVSVIPNAVRSEFFEEDRTQAEGRSVFGLGPHDLVIGVPGTLRPMKGHPFFFDAVAPILRDRNEVRVVVTGGGTDEFTTRLKEKVRDHEIEDKVYFLGWVEDMPAFYRACDMVCIPSRAEPFGRTVIEAFAVGTPVVATAVGGLKEVIRNGKNGLLVSYDDEEALSEAIYRLVENSELRREIAEEAHKEGRKKYTGHKYKEKISSVIEDLFPDK